ncbi:MAG TPA: hypothetical protein VM487_02370, partial [Phycisphaerae bacterium]|nr:hypothetical protein [Phycisphaerae bacterium]
EATVAPETEETEENPETTETSSSAVAEAEPAAADATAETEEQEATPAPALSREEFAKIADQFGADIAVKVMRDGGDYESAMKLAYDAAKEENAQLRTELTEAKRQTNGKPVRVVAAPADGKKTSLFNTGK